MSNFQVFLKHFLTIKYLGCERCDVNKLNWQTPYIELKLDEDLWVICLRTPALGSLLADICLWNRPWYLWLQMSIISSLYCIYQKHFTFNEMLLVVWKYEHGWLSWQQRFLEDGIGFLCHWLKLYALHIFHWYRKKNMMNTVS